MDGVACGRHVFAGVALSSNIEVVGLEVRHKLKELPQGEVNVSSDRSLVGRHRLRSVGEAEPGSERIVKEEEMVVSVPGDLPGLRGEVGVDVERPNLGEEAKQ